MLLNEKLYTNHATQFAERVVKEAGSKPELVIERGFEIALGRLPTSEERDAMRAFLEKQSQGGKIKEAVADLCHALLNLNEFVYVD